MMQYQTGRVEIYKGMPVAPSDPQLQLFHPDTAMRLYRDHTAKVAKVLMAQKDQESLKENTKQMQDALMSLEPRHEPSHFEPSHFEPSHEPRHEPRPSATTTKAAMATLFMVPNSIVTDTPIGKIISLLEMIAISDKDSWHLNFSYEKCSHFLEGDSTGVFHIKVTKKRGSESDPDRHIIELQRHAGPKDLIPKILSKIEAKLSA